MLTIVWCTFKLTFIIARKDFSHNKVNCAFFQSLYGNQNTALFYCNERINGKRKDMQIPPYLVHIWLFCHLYSLLCELNAANQCCETKCTYYLLERKTEDESDLRAKLLTFIKPGSHRVEPTILWPSLLFTGNSNVEMIWSEQKPIELEFHLHTFQFRQWRFAQLLVTFGSWKIQRDNYT